MRGVAPQIPGDREGHAAARRYEGRGAALVSPRAGAGFPRREENGVRPCGNSAAASCQEREECAQVFIFCTRR